MTGEEILDQVTRVMERAPPGIGPVAAALLVAAAHGLARDSRSFARNFGLAHALVLRDCTTLAEGGWIRIDRRDDRTQRLFYTPTDAGLTLANGPDG